MIGSFTKSNAFLSNFFYHPLTYEGIRYPSSEHAYQAAKTLDEDQRRKIASISKPGKVKRAGRRLKIRDDWDDIHIQIMEDILRIKFADDLLASLLLATGKQELVEGNWWKDTFWGVYKGQGENHLGRLLMKIRAELR